MTKITCTFLECKHCSPIGKCEAKEVKLTSGNIATVWEGRKDVWWCKSFEMSEEAKEIWKAVIDTFPTAEVVEVKKGEILLPLCIEELRHLINDAIFYIRKLENNGRNKAEFGYFERQELLEKLRKVERYYERLYMPICKAKEEDEEDTEGNNENI